MALRRRACLVGPSCRAAAAPGNSGEWREDGRLKIPARTLAGEGYRRELPHNEFSQPSLKEGTATGARSKCHVRANFLYLIRCGIVESVPSRRFLSSS